MCPGLLLAVGVVLLIARIPVNKNLYTPSFVLVTAGVGILLLVAVYLVTDVYHMPRATFALRPFAWMGMNSIAIYFGDEVLYRMLVWVFYQKPENNMQSWLFALFSRTISPAWLAQDTYAMVDVVFWCFVAWVLYRRRIFFKV